MNRNDCNNEILKLNTAANNDLMQKPILWSDAIKIPAEVNVLPLTDKIPVEVDASPFTVVNRPRKNQNKNIPEMKSDENIVNTETGKKKKGVKKIIGNKDSEDCKLKANKILIKKSFFSVSNVMKCHRNDVVEYLKSNDINVLSCYPVLKRSEMANDSTPDIENEHSTMFRVCVESCDSNKMKNPDIILKHIIVKDWHFKEKKPANNFVDSNFSDCFFTIDKNEVCENVENSQQNIANICKIYDVNDFNSEMKIIKNQFNQNLFNILHINVRSLLNKSDDIYDFLRELNFEIDVLAISESWLNDSNENLIDINGYVFKGKHRRIKHGGGVGFYKKNNLDYKIRDDITNVKPDSIQKLKNEEIEIPDPANALNNYFVEHRINTEFTEAHSTEFSLEELLQDICFQLVFL
ncbi:hypothetical protein HELRODRAFT_161769 [Helobdella robusta]|uniref:Endonuclease/exonuclease/phosphatase domain-containing protein n=1 Tax=Helobdella robusta TaxID=6412 RepID=T1ERW1_HELRO|nr:hypothetical protein HELRODRAFT_161769 [Helobdella robusta]ESO02494.1 hypothetical protein HELRODRAFT_161769 [Helobdella robusta]